MSPRRRNKDSDGLPPYCYRGRSAIEYKPYLGKGVSRPTHRLCALDAPRSLIWERWEALQDNVKPHTLEWLLRQYAESREFRWKGSKPKSEKTIVEQERQLERIVARPRGRGETFGTAPLRTITPGVIRKYLDARLAEDAGVAGNRERALIQRAWNWAFARDITKLKNPCAGVERNPEEARQHYATDADYEAWLRWLVDQRAPWYIPVVEEICYLCRVRKIEVLTAEKTQILDEGFEVLRRKGSRDAITQWSDRLRAAVVDVPAAFTPARFSKYIVTNTRGQPLRESGFNSVRGRWMKKAIKAGIVRQHFTVHDLKRKGATDSTLDATVSTGNSAAMSRIYDVSKLIATATR